MPGANRRDDLERIEKVVSNLAKHIGEQGCAPKFVFIHPPEAQDAFRKAVGPTGQTGILLPQQGKGFGAAVLQGIRAGIAKYNPQFVFVAMPDHLKESEDFGGIVERLVNDGESHLVQGVWKDGLTTLAEMPHVTARNEVLVSAMVTYANPNFDPGSLKPAEAIKLAVKTGQAYQGFPGVFAFRRSAWKTLSDQLSTTFKGAQVHYNGWALEPALFLAALNSNLNLDSVPARRGFEHEISPESAQGYAASRLDQFDAAAGIVRHFLVATRQSKKLTAFDEYVKRGRSWVENAKLARPGGSRNREKLRPRFLYKR